MVITKKTIELTLAANERHQRIIAEVKKRRRAANKRSYEETVRMILGIPEPAPDSETNDNTSS